MSDVEQQMIFGMTAMNTFAQGVESSAKAVGSFFDTVFDAVRLGRDGKHLRDYLGADKDVVPYLCTASNEKRVCAELRKEGIPYMRSSHGTMTMILVADNRKKEVDQIMDRCRASIMRGGNIPKDILWAQSNGQVDKVMGLTEEEALLFEKKAEEQNIHVSIKERDFNDFMVLFDRKDLQKIAEISSSVAYDLSGRYGDIIRDQLQYERTNEERIFQRATDSKDTLYIVDADGRTAEFHGFYGEFKGPEFGDRKLVKRDSPELPMVYGLMRQPVDLTRKEFEKYKSLNADERKKFLADIEKEHGRPQVSKDEARIMKAHEKDRSLIEQKLTLENPVQSYMEMHITNNEIRMGEFGDMARDNWEDIHDDIESFKEDPTLLNDARARQQAFIVKEEEKTPEDDLREEQFFSGHYEERDDREEDEREQSYHEDYLDVVDKDRNGIPDDMEDHDQYEEER